jgi:hypothetical protein
MSTEESEQARGNVAPPPVHLAADSGVQAYTEPYPRFKSNGSNRAAFIPGRAVVHVAGVQGAWVQVMLDGDVVGWVEGAQLIPPIGVRPTVPLLPNQMPPMVATNQPAINIDTFVAVLAGIGIIMGAVLDWTQGIAANSFKIPALFLFDPHTKSPDPHLGYFVVGLGVAGVFLAFVRNARMWRGLAGAAAIGVAVLYCGQVGVQLSDINSKLSFTDVVGAGPWLTGIAGVALLSSAFLAV